MSDGWLCERFHCLPSDLDEEDTARLMPIVASLNMYASLERVLKTFLDSLGKIKPTEKDLMLYQYAKDAYKELNP